MTVADADDYLVPPDAEVSDAEVTVADADDQLVPPDAVWLQLLLLTLMMKWVLVVADADADDVMIAADTDVPMDAADAEKQMAAAATEVAMAAAETDADAAMLAG